MHSHRADGGSGFWIAGQVFRLPVRDRLGRAGRFGRSAGKLFPVLGLATAKRVLRRTENPRVGGSMPPLATTSNFLNRNGFVSGITRGLWAAAGGENRPTIGLSEIGSGIASRLRRHCTRGPRSGPPSLRSARAGRAQGARPSARERMSHRESQSGCRPAPSRLRRV